jgi:type III restriction enzyme
MLKDYQQKVIQEIESFFGVLDSAHDLLKTNPALATAISSPVAFALTNPKYEKFPDRPVTGHGKLYPRVCIKIPTGGGKTLVAVESIRAYQNILAKRKTGLVVWITHREQIYRQTIENLQNKSHPYRQLLDQTSGNRTLIVEKGQSIRAQDVRENLVVLMLMIQSASKDTNKIFEDSGGYMDFFPPENRYDLHADLIDDIPNLDVYEDTLFEQRQVKTSLGNVIRTQNPLVIVDEYHTMVTVKANETLNGLNPSFVLGLSATPKKGIMNILFEVSGLQLKNEQMIKLPIHMQGPSKDWREMLGLIKMKRDDLEKKARKYEQNKGEYIRPIALLQVERTGREQRGQNFVHSEDVREALIELGVAPHEIAVKSSTLDEIKAHKLLSREAEIRYIITKDALKEGWDCSFAYVLGIIPNTRSNSSMTQLVGRVLRQPYARRTGVSELDESYVYFAQGHTQEVLDKVKKGLEEEGLGDMVAGIEVRDHSGNPMNPPKVVRIKKEILKKHKESLFLPVWLIKEGSVYRQYSYTIDIKPNINWESFDSKKALGELVESVGRQKTTVTEVSVDLDGKSNAREVDATFSIRFDEMYLTRRLSETIDNVFVAHSIAKKICGVLAKKFSAEVLDKDAGYVARELEKHLANFKSEEERKVFEKLVSDGKLILAVSADKSLGFEMPVSDVVFNSHPSMYSKGLYEDVDISSLNSLEADVVRVIEGSPNVLWWSRNKTERGWYAVQGWKKGKIRPDFIIARKNDKDALEFVYVVESKGEQLMGNEDTQYKSSVFDAINAMKGKVVTVNRTVATVRLNDKFEFELVPQKEEERRLRSKL